MVTNLIRSRFIVFVISMITVLIWAGCSDENPVETQDPVIKERGEIISTSSLGTYTPEVLATLLALAEVDIDITFEVSVEVIKIVYQTIDYHGEKVYASGALFIPKSSGAMPLLSMQHGTVTKRSDVASESPFNSTEGAMALITGSIRYITAVPDLLGFGISDLMHPYVHADGNTHVVIDFLRATRSYCQTNNILLTDELFLTGYSEGGYITMALQKEIEKNHNDEFTATAVAPMAGSYDLVATTDYILDHVEYDNPAYIGFFLTAYDNIYNWDRIDEIFAPPYAQSMSAYYSGSYSYGEINNQLPINITQLLTPEFLSGYKNGTETAFINAITENTLLDWAPVAPVKLIHGDADVTVPYINAVNALDNLNKSGATSIELETIAGGTHQTAGLPAFLAAIEWFEGIRD